MTDIVVTTPKNRMADAAQEARDCIEDGGGYYFRNFRGHVPPISRGSKVFYVEDGYLRGYGVVERVVDGPMRCETMGTVYPEGVNALIPAESWKWIEPVAIKGFQGWRYFTGKFKLAGGWKDPKPETGLMALL